MRQFLHHGVILLRLARFSIALPLLASVVIAGGMTGAQAADPTSKPIDNKSDKQTVKATKQDWTITGIRRSDGSFGFCRAELPDPTTGLMLAVALSSANELNLGIKVPTDVSGGFKKGESFTLTLSIDAQNKNAWTKQTTAEAALPDLLLMKLGQDPAFLPAFAKGTRFTVKGDTDATVFTLTGADEAVKSLQQCVTDGNKQAATPTLPHGLAALLQEAKLTVKPLALAGGHGAQAVDVAWVASEAGTELDGGFREARAKKTEDFKSLSDGTINQLKGQCKQGLQIAGGKAEALSSLTLATYDLTCGPEFASVLTYRTDSDIYGVLIHRAALQNKAPAIAVRDRLAAIVRRLGNEKSEVAAVPVSKK